SASSSAATAVSSELTPRLVFAPPPRTVFDDAALPDADAEAAARALDEALGDWSAPADSPFGPQDERLDLVEIVEGQSSAGDDADALGEAMNHWL
ncbi:MAG: hypothetical protein AAF961_07090, partial [Planctomycetota bacterium]